jgi:hypothetical protein
VLNDLGFGDSEPTRLHVDNQSAIVVACNPEHHSRMKHVDRRHYFVCECVENLQIVVPFVASADFFTKALCPKAFFPMRNRIMNHDPGRAAICDGSLPGLPAALPLDNLEASFDL